MKLLFTADVHISDWPAHSTYDEIGVPSRLKLYDFLAQDILDVIRQNKIEAAFFAGDIMQKHSPRPMVSNAVRRFVTTIAGNTDDQHDSIWFSGNHDIDAKTGRYDPLHSGLWPLVPDDHRRIRYFAEPGEYYIPRGDDKDPLKVYIRPWLHKDTDYSTFPKADIFVGHGMVQGSKDPFNYTFTGGYDAEELGARYDLSVLGDIHQAQIITPQRSPGVVLIPGQPIQVNHSSGEQVGVWIYDTESKKLQHIPSSRFKHAEEYHRFLTVDEDPTDPKPNTHYRKRTSKPGGKTKKTAVAPVVRTVDVLDIALKEYTKLNAPHAQIGEDLIRNAYNDFCSTVQPDLSMPPGLLLGKLVVDSFYSINHAEFDFNDLVGDILVVGENGVGKSTFSESVYWCLTGLTTKGTAVGDISNDKTGKPAFVSLEILDTTNSITYRVERSRDSNRLLEIYSGDSKITKASVKESQEWLYKLLGLTDHRDILVLLYFSTAQLLTFSDFTSSEQNQFLNRLTDSDKYEALKTALLEQLESTTAEYRASTEKVSFLEGALEEKQAASANAVRQLDSMVVVTPDYTEEFAQLEDLTGCVASSVQDARDIIARDVKDLELGIRHEAGITLQRYKDQLSEANTQLRVLASNLAGLSNTIESTKGKITQARTNTCPECQQTLPSSDVLDRLMARLRTDADSMRAQNAGVEPLKGHIRFLESSVSEAQVVVDANKSKDLMLRALRAVEAAIVDKEPPSDNARDALRAKIGHITEDITNIEQKIALAKDEVALNAPYYETLKLIAAKMLAKNSALSTRLIHGVFEDMVDKVNELVGNPKVLKAKAETGKTLGMTVSFGGEKPVRVQNMSAGQRRLLDIMVMLAVNALFEQRYNIENGMLGVAFYDEVVAYLGPEYLDVVFTALSNTRARTRVMITHDSDLMSYYNRIIRVSREQGFTQYQLINT